MLNLTLTSLAVLCFTYGFLKLGNKNVRCENLRRNTLELALIFLLAALLLLPVSAPASALIALSGLVLTALDWNYLSFWCKR